MKNKYKEALYTLIDNNLSITEDINLSREEQEELFKVLEELVDRYQKSLELLDWIHEQMYPLVTLYETKTHYGGSVAIKIAEFKKEIGWEDNE